MPFAANMLLHFSKSEKPISATRRKGEQPGNTSGILLGV